MSLEKLEFLSRHSTSLFVYGPIKGDTTSTVITQQVLLFFRIFVEYHDRNFVESVHGLIKDSYVCTINFFL